MWTLTHIVVAVDFGEASDAALAYARMIAAPFNASIALVHVHDDMFARAAMVPEVYGSARPDLADEALNELHGRLTAMLGAAGPRGGTVEVLHGSPAKAIVEYAAHCGASLIVMGTHGRRGLAYAALGSVAGQVLRHAPCPVLVVRRTQEAVGVAPEWQTVLV